MNKFLITAALATSCAAPACATDDVMTNFYGNTIVSIGGSFTIRTHYHPDHTFDFVGSMMFMKRTFTGTWELDGKGNICRTYIGDPPPDTSSPSCAPIVARKVGDVWKSQDGKRTMTLKAGVQ